ncbi:MULTISPECIES: RpiB/LacA/LacB family sugar-phosphate isomerase [Anaeromyxobacter]|uniref:RpiB/LacA/LacB family sugar-phosphate isomerase n=1 Tax=Anaeromyxobacter TaxID=161492 RepID=UPI001F599393|nr:MULTISPECIES: RpiB/LacA/LacB family sugar-phosphate isomerase [unclassified Anaeromyxobacter]
MRVALAADHAGFALKEALREDLAAGGHEIVDLAPRAPGPEDDYPEHAVRVGEAVRSGRAERGVLVCGSGVGVAIAANKLPGVYAGVCHDTYSAHQGVEHDAMNVLALGARVVGEALAREIVRAFLGARPSAEERHRRRVSLTRSIEARALQGGAHDRADP